MASLQTLLINYNGTANDFKSECNLSMGGLDAVQSFVNYIAGLQGGAVLGAELTFGVGATQASATFTVSSTGPTNTQTGSILNQTLTAVTSGAVPASGQFNVSATPATVATGMAAAINATLSDKVVAAANGAVVTITAIVPGVLGNGLQISAGTLSNVVAAAFSGGADGTETVVDLR